MWKLLPLLAVLANLILTVTSARDAHATITTTNNVAAASNAISDGGNKDPQEPKGAEGTPGNGEDEDTDTNPCDDCGKNCYAQGTSRLEGGERTCTTEGGDQGEGTKDHNAGNSSTSTMAASSENSSISQAINRSKLAITKSSGNSSPGTEKSEEGTTQNNEGQGVEENMTTEKSEFSDEHGSYTAGSEITTVGPASGSVSEAMTSASRTETLTEGSGLEARTGDSGMGSKTRKQKEKRRKTTTASTGEPDSSTDVSEMRTEKTASEATTSGSGMETTTEESGMGSKTRNKKKKRRKTTTVSSGEPDSSTDGLDMTTAGSVSEVTTSESRTETSTEGSGSEATTGDSGVRSKTRKENKKRRKTTTTGGSGMETTTGSSGKELTTIRHKTKTKIHRITTTASFENPESSTDGSEMTSEESGWELTTKGSEEEITIEDSEGQATTEHPDTRSTAESTEDSECGEVIEHSDAGSTTESTDELNTTAEEEPESTSTTESSTTTKITIRPRNTTKSIGGTTTRRTKITETPRTTTASGGGATGGTETTTITEGSACTTTTDDLGNTTTDSTMTTTEQQSTTMRGPKDCKGKHEWYFLCAPSCPQQTCADYLNGDKCSKNIGLPKCKPECRCLVGYYKDVDGNCLSTRECKRWARSMASSTATGNLNNQDTTADSTLTMMSTTPEPNCADVAKELFIKGNLAYTVKLLSDMSERDPDNNMLVGGASILYLFAQLVLGAKDTVKAEILKVLNLPDTQHMCRCGGKADLSYVLMAAFKRNIVLEQVRCFFPEISALLTAKYPDVEYSLFCKIYANQGYALTDDFIQRTTQLFVMGPENLNFSSSEAAQKINTDVAKYTNNHFLNYVKPRTLLSLDGLVLVDAEGFQGKWEKQFNPANTIMKDFFSPDRVEKIPTMYQRGLFLFTYSPKLNAKILKLRYRGGRFSLVIILPNFYKIKDLLRKMENPSYTASALDSLKYAKVNVYLPKFNVSVANILKMSSEMIKDLLRKMENPSYTASALDSLKYAKVNVYLPKFNVSVANILKMSSEMAGIKKIFNNSTTGLEDIGSKKPPYVGEILQRLNYAVNEHGMGDKLDVDFPATEVIPRLPKSVMTHTFKADHSFVYFVKFDKIVLNAGLFVN